MMKRRHNKAMVANEPARRPFASKRIAWVVGCLGVSAVAALVVSQQYAEPAIDQAAADGAGDIESKVLG